MIEYLLIYTLLTLWILESAFEVISYVFSDIVNEIMILQKWDIAMRLLLTQKDWLDTEINYLPLLEYSFYYFK